MASVFVWRGGNGLFGTAGNWNDPPTDPATVPPGATDTAEFITDPGTITGTGTVSTLAFLGTGAWVVGANASLTDTDTFIDNSPLTIQAGGTIVSSGTSVAIDSGDTNTAGTAGLLVTGAGSDFAVTGTSTTLLIGTNGDGSLSVDNGATASVAFALALDGQLGTSFIHVDATSSLEIGTAGDAAAGALTIDATDDTTNAQLTGYGTIEANVVNNADLSVAATSTSFQLEITGAVTGTGTIDLQHGYDSGTVHGGILRLDSSVVSTQQIQFGYSSVLGETPELILADPTEFAGTLVNFAAGGDTLNLPGETVTGASITGSSLTVTLASGGPLTFALGGVIAQNSALVAAGSEVQIRPIRDFDWTGTASHAFTNAQNWNDVTDALNPATTAPGTTDFALIANADSLTGNGTVYQMEFSGTNTVTGTISAINTLTVDAGTLAVPGSLSAVGAMIGGTISARSGGSVIIGGFITLVPGAVLAPDGTSAIEAGTDGGAAAGVITIDASSGGIAGNGTLAASVVNNGEINVGDGALGSNELEITGALSGTGGINLQAGFSPSPGTYVAGGLLRLDSAVSASQQISFGFVLDPGGASTLALADPLGFAGVLDEFSLPGDAIDLIGETVTGASVSGSTLTVNLAAGGPLTFTLGFGAPVTSQLLATGSEVRILPVRLFDWIGASGGAFGTASNWNDTTDEVNPAATAPGTIDIASLSNAGAVTGPGTTYQLEFDGTNTVLGTLHALDLLSADSGVLSVTGSLNSGSAFVSGTLAAKSGGRIAAGGSLTLLSGAMIAIDATSAMEVGTAGTGTVGELTVDASSGVVGDGTIAAALVNNGFINASNAEDGDNVFDVTGAVTGSGTIFINVGFSPGSGTIIPGAVVELAGAVASTQHIQFNGAIDPREAPTLTLDDPTAFSGVLDNFNGIGDTLELTGETVTGIGVSGSILTINLSTGGPLTYGLGSNAPLISQLQASGSEIRVVPLRELDWTGAGDHSFNNAQNWNDTTDGLNPAVTAPGTADLASLTNAGSVTGNATAYQLSFTGTNTVTGTLSAIDALTANAGSLVVTGALTMANASLSGTMEALSGGVITDRGTIVLTPGAEIAISGLSSMEIGTAGTGAPGSLTVDASASPGITGDGTLAAALVNNGLIAIDSAASGGNTLEVTGKVTGNGVFNLQSGSSPSTGVFVPGALLQFDSAVAGTQILEFQGAFDKHEAPVLVLNDPTEFTGTLSAFDSPGDVLDLVGKTVTGASIFGSTMTVTVIGGGPLTFALANTPADTPLSFSGSEVSVTAIACFVAGTRILTPRGEVAVETLRVGDTVLTIDGVERPVRWIGHRAVDLARRGTPDRVRPIRVRAHAIAEAQPRHDLLISPDHALFLDGKLFPAKLLVNDASIVVDRECRAVVYYHVELDSHDILLANGLAAESYLDTGNRAMFGNGDEPPRLHPDFDADQHRRHALSRAPFVIAPDHVEPVWRGLAARAQMIGWRLPEPSETTDAPDLHVLIGARRLDPLSVEDGRFVFAIPESEVPARLISRAARPGDARPWADDPRMLGALVRRLRFRSGQITRDIALDDPTLNQGWWTVEWHANQPCRWTSGDSELPDLGPGLLEIEVAGTLRYPVGRAADARRREAA